MPRSDKVAVVDEVRSSLESSVATLLTEYRGLSVSELAELRAELRKAGARYRVAKNTLMRLAAREAGIDGLDDFLLGPTALAFCDEDPVGPAKALKRFAKDHPELVVKGGYLDGEILDAEAAIKLADLESREELLAGIAGLVNGAFAMVVNYADAIGREILGLVTALEDAGGPESKGFGPAEGAAAAAEQGAGEAEEATEPERTEEPAAPEDEEAGGVVETVAEAVGDAVGDAVGTVAEAATDAVDAAAATVADAAETAADALETAADTVAPDNDGTPEDDGSPDEPSDDQT
ncbi:MAG: 50S ribosomal protein L10 [Actinobacteria bacterium]|nr:50S ribosomal protein L10 [Actinomycetota bacterium]